MEDNEFHFKVIKRKKESSNGNVVAHFTYEVCFDFDNIVTAKPQVNEENTLKKSSVLFLLKTRNAFLYLLALTCKINYSLNSALK